MLAEEEVTAVLNVQRQLAVKADRPELPDNVEITKLSQQTSTLFALGTTASTIATVIITVSRDLVDRIEPRRRGGERSLIADAVATRPVL